jgi:DNA-binding transcriptional ArsR family regulator
VHVSELARRLDMSRPLLYMHLNRMEKAGLVTGSLELSDDGKALKYYELEPFELRVTAGVVVDALKQDAHADSGPGDNSEPEDTEETGDMKDTKEAGR